MEKEKFFALYLGQNVYRRNDVNYEGKNLPSDDLSGDILACDAQYFVAYGYLLLRNISQLTDEEVKEFARACHWYGADFKKDDVISLILEFIKLYELPSEGADYLRSIGILIPYMGNSVDEILQKGWAKIKEDGV